MMFLKRKSDSPPPCISVVGLRQHVTWAVGACSELHPRFSLGEACVPPASPCPAVLLRLRPLSLWTPSSLPALTALPV